MNKVSLSMSEHGENDGSFDTVPLGIVCIDHETIAEAA